MKKIVYVIITGIIITGPAMANKGRLESAISPIEAFANGFNSTLSNYNSTNHQQNKRIKATYKDSIYSICLNHVITDDITKHNICKCFANKLSKHTDLNEDLINEALDKCIEKYSK